MNQKNTKKCSILNGNPLLPSARGVLYELKEGGSFAEVDTFPDVRSLKYNYMFGHENIIYSVYVRKDTTLNRIIGVLHKSLEYLSPGAPNPGPGIGG